MHERVSEFLKSNTGFGVALAIALVLSTYLITQTVLTLKHTVRETISVKGSAGELVTSDQGAWFFTVEVESPDLSDAVQKLSAAEEKVIAFLGRYGLKGEEIGLGQPRTQIVHKKIYVAAGNNMERERETDEIAKYVVSVSFRVETKNLDAVQSAAGNVTDLLGEGLRVVSAPVEYRVADLEAVKIRVMGKAIENAHQRAELFVKGAPDQKLKLVSASQGVFQITPPHDTEISAYGRDDTTTVEKMARSVVTIQYVIQ